MTTSFADFTSRQRPAPQLRRHRFTVEQVLLMVEKGILDQDERVELLDGQLWIMSPQGPEHTTYSGALEDRLREAYADVEVHVRNQAPLIAADDALPEPDLSVVRGTRRSYLSRHPSGQDALLVVEVAKTSQGRDRDKAAIYARAGVPVYWLLDLEAKALERFAEPDQAAGRYRSVTIVSDQDEVPLPELDASWTVASMLS